MNKSLGCFSKIIVAFVAIILSVGSANAQQADTVNILFIGNSFTYFNKMPDMVKSLGEDRGIAINYTMLAPGGCTLRRHLDTESEMEVVRQGGWDYVVVQEQSSAPAGPSTVVANETFSHAKELDSLIHHYNPEAKVVLYMTWGHKKGCRFPVEGYPLIDNYQGMQQRLMDSYLEMAYMLDALCAPVGMAWSTIRSRHPEVELYNKDEYHPSAEGSYLAGCVIFTTIFGLDELNGYTADLPLTEAIYIQQVARQTVFDNRSIIGLGK